MQFNGPVLPSHVYHINDVLRKALAKKGQSDYEIEYASERSTGDV